MAELSNAEIYIYLLFAMFWGAFLVCCGFCVSVKFACSQNSKKDVQQKYDFYTNPMQCGYDSANSVHKEYKSNQNLTNVANTDNKQFRFQRLFGGKEQTEPKSNNDETEEPKENIFYK
jgi:hypothetical protein